MNSRGLRNPNSNNAYASKYRVPNRSTLEYMFMHTDKTWHILEGPVRSGKTSDNLGMYAPIVERSPDKLHLAIAQTHSLAKQILFDGDGLGLKHYPDWQARTEIVDGKKVRFRQRIFETKYDGADALLLKPKKGSGHPEKYIIAYGGGMQNSWTKFRGISAGTFLATQYELLHPNTRDELKKRTIASRYRKHVADLNPTSPEHEIYKEFDKYTENGDINYKLKLIHENPIMDEERIEAIKKEYDPDSVEYKRDILGLRVAAEGLIYKVREDNIIKEFAPNDYRTYVISADPGVNSSATTFALIAITNDRKNIDVLKGYYHKNKDKQGMAVKMPSDYAKDYQQFIKECIALMGRPPEDVLSDLDTTFMREFRRTKYQAKLAGITLNSKFRKDEIHQRIKTGINLLWTKRLRFYQELEPFITAYKTASYDEKQKDKGKYVRYDNPQAGTMIDPIDTVEYGITRLRTYINEWRG